MNTSKILLAAALAAAASVAVGGGVQTVENTQTLQAAPAIQVAQAQSKSTKAKKTKNAGKKKVQGGACAGRYVGETVSLATGGVRGTFRVLKVFPEEGEALLQCLTLEGVGSCTEASPFRMRC